MGLLWMGCAALITFIPICLVGLVARGIVKVNCLSLCGVLAGSATAAGPGLRQRAQSVAGAIHRICSRLPADHVPAHRVAANHPRFSLALSPELHKRDRVPSSQQDQTKEVNRQRAARSILRHYYWALRLAEINPEAQQELTAMFMLMETSGFVSPSAG